MPGDMVLTKADAFQGKGKVKDQWNEVEYEVVHQVTNGAPLYEIKDVSGFSYPTWTFITYTWALHNLAMTEKLWIFMLLCKETNND